MPHKRFIKALKKEQFKPKLDIIKLAGSVRLIVKTPFLNYKKDDHVINFKRKFYILSSQHVDSVLKIAR